MDRDSLLKKFLGVQAYLGATAVFSKDEEVVAIFDGWSAVLSHCVPEDRWDVVIERAKEAKAATRDQWSYVAAADLADAWTAIQTDELKHRQDEEDRDPYRIVCQVSANAAAQLRAKPGAFTRPSTRRPTRDGYFQRHGLPVPSEEARVFPILGTPSAFVAYAHGPLGTAEDRKAAAILSANLGFLQQVGRPSGETPRARQAEESRPEATFARVALAAPVVESVTVTCTTCATQYPAPKFSSCPFCARSAARGR